MRARLVPGDDVTFIVDRNVNYTNVCVSGCRFCAFYASPGSEAAYVLSREELAEKVAETIELEGTAILLQGGMHPDLGIEWYEEMLSAIKADHPGIHVHGFGPPEIVHIARLSGISTAETLRRLRDAGLDSLPGGGAEILVDRVRSHVSPKKATSDQWLDVMREAHRLDISTTATMMFGGLETLEERVEHLAGSARSRTRPSRADTSASGRSSPGRSSPATPSLPRTSTRRAVRCLRRPAATSTCARSRSRGCSSTTSATCRRAGSPRAPRSAR